MASAASALDQVLAGRLAGVVHTALPDGDGLVAVYQWPRLARLLESKGVACVSVAADRRALERASSQRMLCSELEHPPFALAALRSAVICDAPASTDILKQLVSGVADGGRVILVGRGARPDHSRDALCAGLVELEQLQAGRRIVTIGTVPSWASRVRVGSANSPH